MDREEKESRISIVNRIKGCLIHHSETAVEHDELKFPGNIPPCIIYILFIFIGGLNF